LPENRYAAFIDACALAGALKRNLLLTLAEAEFFRIRWSTAVLDETQNAIEAILTEKCVEDARGAALRARNAMERAFEDALVTDFDALRRACEGLPDPNDIHVLAAALKTQAAVIVTDNLRDFPTEILAPMNIAAQSTDGFIAETIAPHKDRAVAAIRTMRERFQRPDMTAEQLLLKMEAVGLTRTVAAFKPHVKSL